MFGGCRKNYLCFNCRIGLKAPLYVRKPCPRCNRIMVCTHMRTPKQKKKKEWTKLFVHLAQRARRYKHNDFLTSLYSNKFGES